MTYYFNICLSIPDIWVFVAPWDEGQFHSVSKSSSCHLLLPLDQGRGVEKVHYLCPEGVSLCVKVRHFSLVNLLGIQCLLPFLSHTYRVILSLWRHLGCRSDSSQYVSYNWDLPAILGKVMVVVTAHFLCSYLVLMSTGMWSWPQSIMKASQTGQVPCLGTGTQRMWGPIVIWSVSWELLFGRGACLWTASHSTLLAIHPCRVPSLSPLVCLLGLYLASEQMGFQTWGLRFGGLHRTTGDTIGGVHSGVKDTK